jgi:hypothetical protein
MIGPRKWSWVEFILGWLNKQFLIWCVSTALVFTALFATGIITEKIQFALVIVWGVISFCLFFYKAIYVLIENGKLNVEAKASVGLSKDIKENK